MSLLDKFKSPSGHAGDPEGTAPGAAAKSRRPRLDILSGFRDPVRRPRYIVWSAVSIIVLAMVMILALGVTSSYWFCANGCHKVQDDTIIAYDKSVHSEISCMACHMPVGANPAVFILHKAEALGELYLTITNQYELPLNADSEVALKMPSKQCTQCHNTKKRPITPSEGVLIDHDVHAEKGVTCAICHNRTAHPEDFALVGVDPKTGSASHKHEIFSSMTACFRCHTQGEARTVAELKAPGSCITCHPKDFRLKPPSHLQPGFFPKGHAKLGAAEAARVESATVEAERKEIEADREQISAMPRGGFVEQAFASEGTEHPVGESLVDVALINECSTCHSEKFCSECHGIPMPHPTGFKKDHGKVGQKDPKVCANCHGRVDRFCDGCHHGTSLDRVYNFDKTWISQHWGVANKTGANICFDCHKPTYCAHCHVRGGKLD